MPKEGQPPNAVMAQIAVKRDVPREEAGRVAVIAPEDVCHAQAHRCVHLDRAIAEDAREGECLRAQSECLLVVARELALKTT